MRNLVIVESPAKAKTIERYLGKDFTVKSSFGHIRDLPKKGLNIDIEGDFSPTYEIPADKKKVISELKKAAKSAETVWLASDEDREGEAIAWHLCIALGLDPKKAKRIVFHEITEEAIKAAIANPRVVDEALVNAQQARRVLDRLVGYELSPVLWKKVRSGLSAGRVQSVAVRLLVEREREIEAFKPDITFKLNALLEAGKKPLPAESPEKIKDKSGAREILEAAKTAVFTVTKLEQKPGSRAPGAPFTTSTLQQEGARRLGLSVKTTMSVAQKLYENGHITYMRTDSLALSGFALESIASHINKSYGADYYHKRSFQTKDASAQEAHEAIRPTHANREEAGDDDLQRKVYKLIWRRAIASQMAAAKINRTVASINMSNHTTVLEAKGETLVFDGYLKVYGGGKDDVILPNMKEGETLTLREMTARQVFSRPPARYSEATLVRKLEELGIGRPSTYAPTIGTIQTRGYAERGQSEGAPREYEMLKLSGDEIAESKESENTGADSGKLVPTSLALMANDFLVKHFAPIVDYDFTKEAEEEFDRIADGKETWHRMIKDFYTKDFHPLIKASDSVSRSETSQARKLGKDPKSGKPVFARFGRFGPMLQIGETTDDEKPKFAPMPANTRLETVTFDQAMEMFKLPRVVGKTEDGEEILANLGRFGPYVQVGKLYVSLKDDDPMTVNEATARQLIADKKDSEAKKTINIFGSIKVLNGMYGPYITDGKKNAKIPKETDPKTITEDQAKKMLLEAPEKGKGRRFGRKAAPKTTKRVVKRKAAKKK